MKKVALSLFMISSLSHCMESELKKQKASDDSLEQQQVAQTMFQGEPEAFQDKMKMPGMLITQGSGRLFLLDLRANELYKERDLHWMILDRRQYIATSCIYGDSHQQCSYSSPPIKVLYCPNDKFEILVQGIASVERYLIQEQPAEKITNDFEKMRRADLYLLVQILKTQIIEGTNLNTLPKFLHENHSEWPPKKLSSLVHHNSGYTEITLALAYRAAHATQIEATRRTIDSWSCQVVNLDKSNQE